MCGIAGIVSKKGIAPSHLNAMGGALRHRGPDGEGALYYSPLEGMRLTLDGKMQPGPSQSYNAGLVHRRLQILDLTDAATQPMTDSGTALIFNGEIYNYRELRQELEAEGAVFSSSGDTEVVLKAYNAWGPSCFERFSGMWALVILDTRKKQLVLSRDRFGIKPLYFSRTGGDFFFASEIKSLLKNPQIGRIPNERTIARYLGFGMVDDGDETFYKEISRFPSAHWAEISLEQPGLGPIFHRFWSLPTETYGGFEDEAAEHFRDAFGDAVSNHHHSDVPSGSCLSGGLDSSSIVCVASGMRNENNFSNHTWKSIGYVASDQRFSELSCMETVAEASGTRLETVSMDDNSFIKAFPKIMAVHDEPVGSASVCAQWLVFEHASQAGIRVMLDGQGADETLGGYMGYLLNGIRGTLLHGRFGAYYRLRKLYAEAADPFPLSVPRIFLEALLPTFIRRSFRGRQSRGFSLMTPMLMDLARYDKPWDATPQHDLRATLAADMQNRILPALLRYEDANSMAHSVEARVPFLDHRLVEFAFSLPDAMKINGMERKRVLRKAMRGIVPDSIRLRSDKIGFKASPSWTFSLAAAHRDEFLENATDFERQWFDERELTSLFREGRQADQTEIPLWRVMNVKQWVRSL